MLKLSKNITSQAWYSVTVIPVLRRQEDCCECQASLGYNQHSLRAELRLRGWVLGALPECPNPISSAHTVADNHPVPRNVMPSVLCEHCMHVVQRYTCRQIAYTYKIKIFFFKTVSKKKGEGDWGDDSVGKVPATQAQDSKCWNVWASWPGIHKAINKSPVSKRRQELTSTLVLWQPHTCLTQTHNIHTYTPR